MGRRFELHDARVILSSLASSHPQRRDPRKIVAAVTHLLPADYVGTLGDLGECEIAADFVFLGPKRLKEENALREAPLAKLGMDWWIFATSGSGDGWLIRRKGRASEVAFLALLPFAAVSIFNDLCAQRDLASRTRAAGRPAAGAPGVHAPACEPGRGLLGVQAGS